MVAEMFIAQVKPPGHFAWQLFASWLPAQDRQFRLHAENMPF